jgi:predicted 3-demethylubiquinone-9 3-methyltransferase (glyoxalase superfamily)
MDRITPCLWFNGQAEPAVEFYVTVFKNAKKLRVTHYGPAAAEASGLPEDSVLGIEFELEGQSFFALNATPEQAFTPAISLMVSCETQQEIDAMWAPLAEGGKELGCGWVSDRFGVTWQITPRQLLEMIHDPDGERRERVMRAMMPMVKIDLAAIGAAYAGP